MGRMISSAAKSRQTEGQRRSQAGKRARAWANEMAEKQEAAAAHVTVPELRRRKLVQLGPRVLAARDANNAELIRSEQAHRDLASRTQQFEDRLRRANSNTAKQAIIAEAQVAGIKLSIN